MKCSACQAELNEGGYCNECGFSLPRNVTNIFNPNTTQSKCAITACYLPVMPGTGKCEYHYLKPHQEAADRKCAELGLHTTGQRAWLKANAGKAFKRFDEASVPTREPGLDDEWRQE